MSNSKLTNIMEAPFPKSTSMSERLKLLMDTVSRDDALAILITADPDAMASAMALRRLFWRKVRLTGIYHTNVIKRADNLAMINLLKLNQRHIRMFKPQDFTKFAILDSQPSHNDLLSRYNYDIIIDHHPFVPQSKAKFLDIKEEYGATSSMMTEYLRAAGIKPSPRLATALFYGIKTDTDNFVRDSTPNDINAFRYLFQFVNGSIIKKIESSELTKNTLQSFRTAMNNLIFVKDRIFIPMDNVSNPDILVLMADFFLKMAEVTWSVAAGISGKKLVIIFRNAGFRLDAGKVARKLFGEYGSAGGHKSAARAEIPLANIENAASGGAGYAQFVVSKLKEI
ncbi:MAG: DHH family phosphoesterase [Deltaproteobacteria bacterium]|nr:DHH family phosphoesterase [Deltaproteobacteria bacterium]